MKERLLLYGFLLLPATTLSAQTSGQNYVLRRTMLNEQGSGSVTTVSYYDGLGRLSETATNGQGTGGRYVYTLQHYDGGDRVVWQTLPAPATASPDWLDSAAVWQKLATQYPGEGHPYLQDDYDALGRPVTRWGAGDSWRTSDRPVRHALASNKASEVRRYSVTADNKLKLDGYYAAGTLYKETVTDEDKRTTVVYTDIQGRTVMEQRADCQTCYVYDGYGRLAFVLPPTLSDRLTTANATWDASATLVRQYAYCYRYDGRHRCVWKQLPGCDAVTMQYDRADRLLFSCDGNQSAAGRKTFHLYDKFGREAVTGTCSKSDAAAANDLALATYTGTGAYGGYATGLTLTSVTLLTVSYYDDYRFKSRLPQAEQTLLNHVTDGAYTSPTTTAAGYQTGSLTYQLDDATKYSASALYYDIKGRVVYAASTNHLGGKDATYTHYTFMGKTDRAKHIHTAADKATQTEQYIYDYDGCDRLIKVRHTMNGAAQKTLAEYTYDDLGRVRTKKIGGLETVTNSYNLRGWLTGIASTKFTEAMGYNMAVGGITPANRQYGGNIALMTWKTGNDNRLRGCQYTYDNLSRLTAAAYGEGSGLGTNKGRYSETFQYDKMGNVEAVTRYGLQDNNAYGKIDDLAYTYNGNQVTKVDDDVSGPFYSGAFHFVDGSDAGTEYTYDRNGNMTRDLNKDVTSIQYNTLNLPSKVVHNTYGDIDYTYDAAGRKLRTYNMYVRIRPGHGGGTSVPIRYETQYDYCGNVIYRNGNLSQILIEGGYITMNGTTPQYHYYLTDHLGNNRVVFSEGNAIEQVNHYYAFGGLMGESTNGDVQRFKYNGKELDRLHGLDWYDYGARQMDGMRFTTIDPLAEKYYGISPYVYCVDNPIKLIDRKGEEPTTYEAALMAKHAYGEKVQLSGGWHVSDTQYESFINAKNGFKSSLYERTLDGVKEYAYATAGTESINDFKEDVLQLVGNSSQYIESVKNAKKLSHDLAGYELTFVGHSLGGGLAAANALATDKNAITFNPAAISNATKTNLQLPVSTTKGRIFNVIVKGEIVNYLQSKIGLKPEGGNFNLDASYLPGNNIINTALRIRNHLINTVIKKIEEEQKR